MQGGAAKLAYLSSELCCSQPYYPYSSLAFSTRFGSLYSANDDSGIYYARMNLRIALHRMMTLYIASI
jgi:hypothetical protein